MREADTLACTNEAGSASRGEGITCEADTSTRPEAELMRGARAGAPARPGTVLAGHSHARRARGRTAGGTELVRGRPAGATVPGRTDGQGQEPEAGPHRHVPGHGARNGRGRTEAAQRPGRSGRGRTHEADAGITGRGH